MFARRCGSPRTCAPGSAPQPQFVIWPEDSSDIDPLLYADAGQEIQAAAQAIGAPILVGTVLDADSRMQEPPEYTNTVIVWNPITGPADRHDKEIVQPFGEYLPMPWLFKHLSGYAGRAGHFVPRTRQRRRARRRSTDRRGHLLGGGLRP